MSKILDFDAEGNRLVPDSLHAQFLFASRKLLKTTRLSRAQHNIQAQSPPLSHQEREEIVTKVEDPDQRDELSVWQAVEIQREDIVCLALEKAWLDGVEAALEDLEEHLLPILDIADRAIKSAREIAEYESPAAFCDPCDRFHEEICGRSECVGFRETAKVITKDCNIWEEKVDALTAHSRRAAKLHE